MEMNILTENLHTFAAHKMYNLNHERHMHHGPMDMLKIAIANQTHFFAQV